MGLVWEALWKAFPELYGLGLLASSTREGAVQPRDRSRGERLIWTESIGVSLLPEA